MKQFTIIVETLVTSIDESLFLIRDPRTGNVIKTFSSPSEVASFLTETIISLETKTSN